MSNRFEAEGNLGNAPELRTVTVNGADRDVMDFSIYIERRVPDGNGGFTDKGGFWLNCSLWGGRARATHAHLKAGTRTPRPDQQRIYRSIRQSGKSARRQ